MNEILAALAVVIAKQEQEIVRLRAALQAVQEPAPPTEPAKRPAQKR